jgi:hypothetical protein
MERDSFMLALRVVKIYLDDGYSFLERRRTDGIGSTA